jgi:hypothetical protein
MSLPNTFQDNYPFVACVKSNDIEYVGIVINFDDYVASIYDISVIKTDEEKRLFLEMGEVWWWESNRKIPINSKDAEIVFGPTVNLSEIAEKRIKRKSIQLVRIPKNIRN